MCEYNNSTPEIGKSIRNRVILMFREFSHVTLEGDEQLEQSAELGESLN